MTGEELHDLAPLYAIDALDDDEARRFEHHLPSCAPCQRELAELRSAVTALAVGMATPLPPGLRQRVLVEVARQPQLRAPAPAAADPAGTTGDDPAITGPGPGPIGDPSGMTGGGGVARLDEARARRRGGRSRPTGPSRWLAAVAAAVLVVVGAAGVWVGARGGSEGGERTAVEAAFAAVRAAPDARAVELAGGEPGARVQVAWSAAQNRVVLLADGMPDPGVGRTYELWRIDADGPDPAGLFGPDGSGEAGLVAPLDGADPTAWGVTVEPDGGSPAPTPPIVYEAKA